ncbi:MAG: hypothetical protein EA382_16845 [Spirochaetaceae bacterium]|nr:MAG: hypothetical protein EA382_16845 [Spirochaetaceae bacterium]
MGTVVESRRFVAGVIPMRPAYEGGAALGGGAIRDLILGITPPVNLLSPAAIVLAAGPAFILSLRPIDRALRSPAIRRILPLSHALVTADALGLAAFTVSGVSAAGLVSDSVTLALFCGVLTATGGGMLRDLLAGAVPAISAKYLMPSKSSGRTWSEAFASTAASRPSECSRMKPTSRLTAFRVVSTNRLPPQQ